MFIFEYSYICKKLVYHHHYHIIWNKSVSALISSYLYKHKCSLADGLLCFKVSLEGLVLNWLQLIQLDRRYVCVVGRPWKTHSTCMQCEA